MNAARVIHLVADDVSVLLVLRGELLPTIAHWGRRLAAPDGDLLAFADSTLRTAIDGESDVQYDPSLLPEHTRGWGGRPGLSVHRSGTAWSPRLSVQTVEVDGEPVAAGQVVQRGAATVSVVARDEVAQIAVLLELALTPAGLLRTRAVVRNESDSPGPLDVSAVSLALTVPTCAREVLDFAGRWATEKVPQRHPVVVGMHTRESRRGRTGLDATATMAIGTPGFDARSGEVWLCHVGFGGNHEHAVERADGYLAFRGGELLLPGEVRLEHGQEYSSPWVYGSHGDGLDAASHRFHRFLRGVSRAAGRPRPVTLNVWEAVLFDQDHDTLAELASQAADLGVERYVVDDGWFRRRRDDRAGLGDWTPDPDVWPDGLGPERLGGRPLRPGPRHPRRARVPGGRPGRRTLRGRRRLVPRPARRPRGPRRLDARSRRVARRPRPARPARPFPRHGARAVGRARDDRRGLRPGPRAPGLDPARAHAAAAAAAPPAGPRPHKPGRLRAHPRRPRPARHRPGRGVPEVGPQPRSRRRGPSRFGRRRGARADPRGLPADRRAPGAPPPARDRELCVRRRAGRPRHPAAHRPGPHLRQPRPARQVTHAVLDGPAGPAGDAGLARRLGHVVGHRPHPRPAHAMRDRVPRALRDRVGHPRARRRRPRRARALGGGLQGPPRAHRHGPGRGGRGFRRRRAVGARSRGGRRQRGPVHDRHACAVGRLASTRDAAWPEPDRRYRLGTAQPASVGPWWLVPQWLRTAPALGEGSPDSPGSPVLAGDLLTHMGLDLPTFHPERVVIVRAVAVAG